MKQFYKILFTNMIPKRYYIKNFPISYVISYIDFTSRDIPEKKIKIIQNKRDISNNQVTPFTPI